MTALQIILAWKEATLADVTEHLDGLSVAERSAQVVSLNRAEQEKLWALAKDSEPLDLTYLVPEDAKPLEYFPFEGKNSLPAFKRFQKVFYRDSEGKVCGYNNNPYFIAKVIGPGYYVTGTNPKCDKELQVDYTRIPAEKPADWPAIQSNDIFPAMFVYGGTKDNLRWVSKDVLIGRAFKMGEDPMPNWFVLCRTRR